MARVLVTGAAGFLGSHLCDALIKENHYVIGVDCLLGGDVENVPEDVVTFRKFNCGNHKQMDEACKGVDIVYHCAAFPHEGLSVFSPVTVTRSVYDATVVTATAAIKAGVKRFVFTSSMARYGEQKELPFYEGMICKPVDPYGIAKYAAEQTLKCLGKAHGMEIVILVPHNVAGIRQRYTDPFRNVISIMANLMLQGRQPFIYGDGKQKRCFTFVSDVMDSFLKSGFRDNMDGQVINIGPDENPVTILELATVIADVIGFKLDPVFVPDRPCEVKQAWCSANKARALFGYETKTGLREGIAGIVEWIKTQGPKPFEYHLAIEIQSDKTPKTWKDRLF